MPTSPSAEERLRQIYDLLRDWHGPSEDAVDTQNVRWHAPALPPMGLSGRSSATDLLNWWFRPPSRGDFSWDDYFARSDANAARQVAGRKLEPSAEPGNAGFRPGGDGQPAVRALVDWPEDQLSNEDADAAVEVLYEFLHSFGRKDVACAMENVAEDYHVFEQDREIDRRDFYSYLESLLESLHGFEFEVGLTTIPEALRHPYGIVIYAEMQIDALRAGDGVRRNLVDRRLVLLQKQPNLAWKIAAFSKPQI